MSMKTACTGCGFIGEGHDWCPQCGKVRLTTKAAILDRASRLETWDTKHGLIKLGEPHKTAERLRALAGRM